MNTQLNIKTRRMLVNPSFVTLSVGLVVVLAAGFALSRWKKPAPPPPVTSALATVPRQRNIATRAVTALILENPSMVSFRFRLVHTPPRN